MGVGLTDVFISYARADSAMAARVAKALQGAGFTVWWDADLPAHQSYSQVIERNLGEARAVVVLWSNAAANSQWVRAEADFARNAGKLVQAQVDDTLPPMPFNQIQSASLLRWRGSADHPGWAKLRSSVAALTSGSPASAEAPPRSVARIPRSWSIAAVLVVMLAAIVFFALRPPSEARKPVLAVLPFNSLDARDQSLAAGMWEDTRQAIGRNAQLVVLGPNSAEQLAGKSAGDARHAADYLVQASIRTAGDRIRINGELVRTKDGAQLWSQSFDRKLDDVFELQSDIAREIEGRIRGRLAKQGGVMPEHIATSGEVYALYSDARAKIRKRSPDLYDDARVQLEQVVRMDPNFAPGWATLSETYSLIPPSVTSYRPYERTEEYARKAIELAPNLAAGHAALALALGLEGPVARAEIARAVQLDPSDYEAVVWLGNLFNIGGRKKEALDAYTRAVEIEPLFWPAVLNKFVLLDSLADQAGIDALIENERRLGADQFVAAIKMERAAKHGDLAEAANMGLDYWKTGKAEGRPAIQASLWAILLQLGYIEQSYKISPAPDFAPYLWRNDPKGLDMLEAHHIPPHRFFSMSPLPQNAGRVYLLSRQSAKLSDMYSSLHMAPETFARLVGGDEEFLTVAPLVAIALRQTGQAEQSAQLLAAAERAGTKMLKDGAPLSSALLARVYATQNRKDEALALLAAAVIRNWLPQPPMLLVDLGLDPALAGLKGDARFERLRDQVLGTVKRERALVRIASLS